MKNNGILRTVARKLFLKILTIGILATLALGGPPSAFSDGSDPPNIPTDSKSCPWKITGLEIGRWMNGNMKFSTWAHGSFPLTGWITERPIWYINGTKIGRSWPFFNLKRIPHSSRYLKKGQNTVMVKFFKPPYANSSNTYTFTYDPNKIKPGQHIKF